MSGAPRVTWLYHDLSSPRLPKSMPNHVSSVVHLAQSPHFREFPEQALHIFDVNVGSTMRLLHWARTAGARCFVYASSGGIYGHGDQDFKEDDVVGSKGPLGFYFASKQCGEFLVENYSTCFTIVILRFFFVYGRGQRPTMLIPRLVRSVLDGRPILLQGEEGMRLNPIHVDDAVTAIARSLELKESHKINVGGPEVLTLKRIGEIIGSHVKRAPRYQIEEVGPPRHLVGDISKMTRLLGGPSVRFADGVREVCHEVAAG